MNCRIMKRFSFFSDTDIFITFMYLLFVFLLIKYFYYLKKKLIAVDKRMDAKIEPHRTRSVTYAILLLLLLLLL